MTDSAQVPAPLPVTALIVMGVAAAVGYQIGLAAPFTIRPEVAALITMGVVGGGPVAAAVQSAMTEVADD
jgi:hypothetical protein